MAKSQRKKPEKAKAILEKARKKPEKAKAILEKAEAKPRAKPGRKVKARKGVVAKLLPVIASLPSEASVLDRLHAVVLSRRDADPNISHSARLLSRGTAKVAQKFGEEAVECLIEAVGGNSDALVAESADVLYHLIVLWVSCGVTPDQIWAELTRREGISGIAEKAARPKLIAALRPGTSKIP